MEAGQSRFCPRCGVGYAPSTPRCPSCDIALTSERASAVATAPAAADVIQVGDDLPPLEELVGLRVSDLGFARTLSEALLAGGISHRLEKVDPSGRGDRFAVLVAQANLDRARTIEHAHLRDVLPDIPDNFDPEAADDSACPACGEPVGATDEECASCGLFFGPPVEA